jgi:hypothetical protein
VEVPGATVAISPGNLAAIYQLHVTRAAEFGRTRGEPLATTSLSEALARDKSDLWFTKAMLRASYRSPAALLILLVIPCLAVVLLALFAARWF